jgi:hypothetical protein
LSIFKEFLLILLNVQANFSPKTKMAAFFMQSDFENQNMSAPMECNLTLKVNGEVCIVVWLIAVVLNLGHASCSRGYISFSDHF